MLWVDPIDIYLSEEMDSASCTNPLSQLHMCFGFIEVYRKKSVTLNNASRFRSYTLFLSRCLSIIYIPACLSVYIRATTFRFFLKHALLRKICTRLITKPYEVLMNSSFDYYQRELLRNHIMVLSLIYCSDYCNPYVRKHEACFFIKRYVTCTFKA